MGDARGSLLVQIITAPAASCGRAQTWAEAAKFIGQRLNRRFNGRVAVEHVEIFSQRSFEFPAVLEAVQQGAELPIVLLDDRIISQGGKLSESRIVCAIEALDSPGAADTRRE